MAKVAIEAAMPESRIMMRPTMRAKSAARRPAMAVETKKGNCVWARKAGRPWSVTFFITGGMVSQAAA